MFDRKIVTISNHVIVLLIAISMIGCHSSTDKKNDAVEEKFDKAKWLIRQDKDYPYRDAMLHDLVYKQRLKGLHRD